MRFLPVLLSAAALGCASAQDGPGPDFSYLRISPVLKTLDADGDGVISASEMKNAPAALRSLDANHDGQLTAEEVRPAFGGRGGRGGEGQGEREANGPTATELQDTLLTFDRNKDGKLSKDELPERMQGMFDRGDTNKDGFLTKDEIARLAAGSQPLARPAGEGRGEGEGRGRPRGPGNFMAADPVLAALDTDHDSVISAGEIDNAPAALRSVDKNGDGRLTEDEVRPAFGPRGFGGRGRGPQ